MKIYNKFLNQLTYQEKSDINKLILDNNGLIFHEINFNIIVSDIFKTKLLFKLVYRENNLVAFIVFHVIFDKFKKVLYSGPTNFEVPYGGWVYNKQKIDLLYLINLLKPQFNEMIIYWSNIQILTNEYKNKININKTKEFQTSLVDLKLSEDDIWKNYIHSKRRNMIRKALKNNITINFYSAESLQQFYNLSKELHHRIGQKTKPFSYFEKIIKSFYNSQKANILIATKDNQLLSSIFLIGNKNIIHYWQGASKSETPNLGQNELLQWEAIKWSKNIGANYYDLCVIKEDKLPYIARFKKGISKEMHPFYYFVLKNNIYKILSKI